jgi:PIN domain nuclease of toxin-antitoxin system
LRLLLDTQCLLWWLSANSRLGPNSRHLIDSAVDVVLSTVSVWEISIKLRLGKLDVAGDVFDRIEKTGYRLLPVAFAHAVTAGALPPHHRDPFDRMLVAQAQLEGLTIMTSDRRIHAYDVAVVPAS